MGWARIAFRQEGLQVLHSRFGADMMTLDEALFTVCPPPSIHNPARQANLEASVSLRLRTAKPCAGRSALPYSVGRGFQFHVSQSRRGAHIGSSALLSSIATLTAANSLLWRSCGRRGAAGAVALFTRSSRGGVDRAKALIVAGIASMMDAGAVALR